MMGCKKCTTMHGFLLLVLGVLFLLRDLGMWNFWNVQWWTAVFLLFGAGAVCKSNCSDCQAMCKTKK